MRIWKPLLAQRNAASNGRSGTLITTPQRLPPEAKQPVPEQAKAFDVSRHGVVVEVCAAMNPAVQVNDATLQPDLILRPCYAVHAGCGFPLQ